MGASSPPRPALHEPEPQSITTALTSPSSAMLLGQCEIRSQISVQVAPMTSVDSRGHHWCFMVTTDAAVLVAIGLNRDNDDVGFKWKSVMRCKSHEWTSRQPCVTASASHARRLAPRTQTCSFCKSTSTTFHKETVSQN